MSDDGANRSTPMSRTNACIERRGIAQGMFYADHPGKDWYALPSSKRGDYLRRAWVEQKREALRVAMRQPDHA